MYFGHLRKKPHLFYSKKKILNTNYNNIFKNPSFEEYARKKICFNYKNLQPMWSKENSKCMSGGDLGSEPSGPTSGSSTSGKAEGFQTSGHVQYQTVNSDNNELNNELKKAGMLGMF